MIAVRATGSVVDLKRAIKDAKDKAYCYKFGELVGYYPHFSSGNLEFNGETLHNTYSLKQVGALNEVSLSFSEAPPAAYFVVLPRTYVSSPRPKGSCPYVCLMKPRCRGSFRSLFLRRWVDADIGRLSFAEGYSTHN